MIKAIIFDWAGVIGADGLWPWLSMHVQDMAVRRPFFLELCDKVDSAKISHDEFIASLAKESGMEPGEVWPSVKKEMVINHDLIQIMRRLKQNYKIGLLSNFTFPWLNELLTENELYDIFDAHIISSEHKVIKPQREAFEKILRMLGVEASESVFIDDRQMHVNAANKLGMLGILFTGNTKLVADLGAAGVSI